MNLSSFIPQWAFHAFFNSIKLYIPKMIYTGIPKNIPMPIVHTTLLTITGNDLFSTPNICPTPKITADNITAIKVLFLLFANIFSIRFSNKTCYRSQRSNDSVFFNSPVKPFFLNPNFHSGHNTLKNK